MADLKTLLGTFEPDTMMLDNFGIAWPVRELVAVIAADPDAVAGKSYVANGAGVWEEKPSGVLESVFRIAYFAVDSVDSMGPMRRYVATKVDAERAGGTVVCLAEERARVDV